MADVTVAVVSFQTREHLRACLTALAEEPGTDVFVVDNGSTDGSQAMVREAFPAVTLLEPGQNLGYGAAVNLVARETSTPWLVAANADVVPEPGALAALLRAGGGRAGRSRRPRLLRPDGTTEHSVHPFPGLRFTAAFALGLTEAYGDRLCLEGAWDPEQAAPRPVGDRRAAAASARSVRRGGRLRRAPVALRRGPRPRLAPAPRRLGHPLRARRAGAARGVGGHERLRRRAHGALAARDLRVDPPPPRDRCHPSDSAAERVRRARPRAPHAQPREAAPPTSPWARLHARTGLLTAKHRLAKVR